MSKIRRPKIEVPKYLAFLLKTLALLAFLFVLNDIYGDISQEYITRRGWTYTLHEDPFTFYLNILKRSVIGIVFLYLAAWGIQGDDEKTRTENR